jgi:hypothetical protein
LLRKCLYCESTMVGQSLCLINCCEVALSQFSYRFEHLMESFLIESLLEGSTPCLGNVLLEVNCLLFFVLVVKMDPYFG